MDPNDAEFYFNQGNVHFEAGDYESALTDYTHSIGLDSNHASAYFKRGNAHYALEAYESAIADYRTAIGLNPDDAKAYFNRGVVHHSLKDYESALTDYTKVIDLDPDWALAYHNQGIAHYSLDAYESAVADFTKAIGFDPDYASAYNNRGNAHYALKDYESAVADYTTAIGLDPDYASTYYNRGNAHHALNDCESAIADYTTAIGLDPDYVSAYYNRGIAHYSLDAYESAVADHTMAIGLDPDYISAYYNRGIAHYSLDAYESAIADYTTAIGLDPDYVLAYHNRGSAHYALNDCESAIADYTTAIGLDPDYVSAYYNRGSAHYSLDAYESAIADYTTAIGLDPDYASAYNNRAKTYTKIADYASAQADYVRYVFLGKVGYDEYYPLLTFFRDFADAPFVVKRLLADNPVLGHLHSYQSFLERAADECTPVLDFLDSLEQHGWAGREPERFLHLSARCHYFMGDTAEAFGIIDNEIDGTYPHSLMSHYYYVLSAQFSALPERAVAPLRADAIEAAIALHDAAAPVSLVEMYYAGLVLHHFGDETEAGRADSCFNRAKGLLPAKYMRWLLAPPAQRETIRQDILTTEVMLPPNKSFGKGIQPQRVGLEFSDYGPALQHYCFYHEIAEAIQGIHAGDVPTQTVSFYDYWQFSPDKAAQETLQDFRKRRDARHVYHQIGERLAQIKQRIDVEKLDTGIRESIRTIEVQFETLKRDAETESGAELERKLASTIYDTALLETYNKLNISGFGFLEVHQKFTLYFFSMDKLSTRATISLIFYAIYTAQRYNKSLLPAILREGTTEGVVDEIKSNESLKEVGSLLVQQIGVAFATTWGSVAGVFFIGFMVKALLLVINETVLKPGKAVNAHDDYRQFLETLDAKIAVARQKQEEIPGLDVMLQY